MAKANLIIVSHRLYAFFVARAETMVLKDRSQQANRHYEQADLERARAVERAAAYVRHKCHYGIIAVPSKLVYHRACLARLPRASCCCRFTGAHRS